MKHLVLITLILNSICCYSQTNNVDTTFKPSEQDKQETIDWILEKLNKYAGTYVINEVIDYEVINNEAVSVNMYLTATQKFKFDGCNFIVQVNSVWQKTSKASGTDSKVNVLDQRIRNYTYVCPINAFTNINWNYYDVKSQYGGNYWGNLELNMHSQEVTKGTIDNQAVHKFGHSDIWSNVPTNNDWDEYLGTCNIYFNVSNEYSVKERLETAFNHLKKYYCNQSSKSLEKF